MRGTKGVTKRLIAFVLSFIMVTGTFMTDYTIVRASEEVEETTSDVEETSEAEESEEPEAEEEPEATEEEVVEEENETTEDEVIEEETEITEEEVVEEETETTEEVVGEELTGEELLEEEVLEEEIIEIIEEMIKISFKAGKGGSVSVSEQELGAEDDVEEVTATADEGYEFVNWTKDGKEVSADETFTPAKEAATYVANFEAVEEDVIVISFEAGKGGSVSASEQELGEEDEVEAVTATADEGYEFVNWTKDGKEVSTSKTFTPAKEEAIYVANFKAVEELEFNQSEEVDGVKISLYAKPGVLPSDAELQVVKVNSVLEEEIKEAINSETEGTVEETISFDINIYSASAGGYVQPEDGTVSVTFELSDVNADGKKVGVYHVKESGNAVNGIEEVAAPVENADEVAFEAEHFSVYTAVVVSEAEETVQVCVYVMDDGWEGNQQKEDQLGLHKKDANGFYPVDVVEIPSKFVEGVSPYLNDDATWEKLKPYLNDDKGKINTSKAIFTDSDGFKEANGNNHMVDYLDNVNSNYKDIGSGYTALFDWPYGGSYGFDHQVVYHLDLRLEVRTVTFKNGNNGNVSGLVEGETVFGTRGYFENEKIENPNASTYDFYLENIPEGYAVVGYYKDAGFTEEYQFGNPIKENETVYVKLEKELKYTVTWMDGAEQIDQDKNVVYGVETLSLAPVVENKSYNNKFIGWSVENDGTVDAIPTVVTEDATYYAVFEKADVVYYYLLSPDLAVPSDSSDQSQANYYPLQGEGHHAWEGTAVPLEDIPAEDKDKFGNVYGEELVGKYLISIPQDTIDDYLVDKYGEMVEVVWYTYKKAGKELHVDGYLKNVAVEVEYRSNYPEEMEEKSFAKTEKTGTYRVKSLDEEWQIDGYTFKGWALSKDATDAEYQPRDVYELKSSTVFYAVWEKVSVSDGEGTDDDETTNEDGGDSTGGGSTGGGSTGGGSSSGGDRSASDVGRVLGARREDIATASEDGQVLGAVRAPKTSDASRTILWMLVMGTTALGAAAVLAQKKEEE